jgi:hypothetical protein
MRLEHQNAPLNGFASRYVWPCKTDYEQYNLGDSELKGIAVKKLLARMAQMKTAAIFRGIIGKAGDRAIVVSLPCGFSLEQALSDAEEIRVATAFARNSGWQHLESNVLAGHGTVSLLTGLDFMQTEPRLLRRWLELMSKNTRVRAQLASKDSMFHPKVLLVKPELCVGAR